MGNALCWKVLIVYPLHPWHRLLVAWDMGHRRGCRHLQCSLHSLCINCLGSDGKMTWCEMDNQWDSSVRYGIQSASCQSLRELVVKACYSSQADSFRGGYDDTRSEADYIASSQCESSSWEGQVVHVVLRPMISEMHLPTPKIWSWIFPGVNCLFRSKSRSFKCLRPWETGRSAFLWIHLWLCHLKGKT